MSEVFRASPQGRSRSPLKANLAVSRAGAEFDIHGTLMRAVSLHQSGELDEAEALYKSVRNVAPKNADAIQFLGVLAHQRGNSADAVKLLTKALKLEPNNISCHNNLGNVYAACGDEKKALFHFSKAAQGDNASIDALVNIAILHRRGGDLDSARDALIRARVMAPREKSVLNELAGVELQRRDFEAAEEVFSAYVTLAPDDLLALNNLAYAIQQQGRYGESERIYEKVLAVAGHVPEFGYNARVAKILQGRTDEAEQMLRAELEKTPELWTAELGLAVNLAARGHADRAIEHLRMILKILPDDASVWTDVGLVFVNMKKIEEGIKTLSRAIELNPDEAIAHNAIGCAYVLANYPTLAVASFKAAIKANPSFIEPYSNLCRALRGSGEYDQANVYGYLTFNHEKFTERLSPNLIQLFRANCDFDGLEKVGNVWDICDRLPEDYLPALFLDLLVYAADHDDLRRFVGLVERWVKAQEKRAKVFPETPPAVGRSVGKLRIGFLSSDLRTHSVSRFLVPLMRGYDKSRFEFYCYTSVRALGDPLQELFKGAVDRFTFVDNKNGWEIAQVIRGDEVDILFDLNGFTEGTMLEALVFKPAPVQVSWLGYPFTCGLATIDHVVLDQYIGPAAKDYLAEEPILMPEAWVCFGKFAGVPIADGLPMDRAGRVTFGTLNNPYKFTPRMIANWARVLCQVPNSRFLLVRPEARSHTICRNISREFAKHGIESDRLYFFDNTTRRDSHLTYYNEIDVSLDTFPLTGGTTTCEATWMGVPVVSLVGQGFQQRISYSALMHCGLDELCTFDDASFVAKAVELANDRKKLLAWRHGLRDVVAASPLCDHEKFIYQFQEMLEQVAQHHHLR